MNYHKLASWAFGFFAGPVTVGLIACLIGGLVYYWSLPDEFKLNLDDAWSGAGVLVIVFIALLIGLRFVKF